MFYQELIHKSFWNGNDWGISGLQWLWPQHTVDKLKLRSTKGLRPLAVWLCLPALLHATKPEQVTRTTRLLSLQQALHCCTPGTISMSTDNTAHFTINNGKAGKNSYMVICVCVQNSALTFQLVSVAPLLCVGGTWSVDSLITWYLPVQLWFVLMSKKWI